MTTPLGAARETSMFHRCAAARASTSRGGAGDAQALVERRGRHRSAFLPGASCRNAIL
jgi:hypothetical protein